MPFTWQIIDPQHEKIIPCIIHMNAAFNQTLSKVCLLKDV
jgi:hypothetical protein